MPSIMDTFTGMLSDNAAPDDQHEEPFDAAPVLFCPVCCTNVDAEKWGPQTLECTSCNTAFIVDLKPDIVAEHSMIG